MPRSRESRLKIGFKDVLCFKDETCSETHLLKLYNGSVIGFGVRHKEVLTKEGTFKCFMPYGYFDTFSKRHFCTKITVMDLSRRLGYKTVNKEVVIGHRASGAEMRCCNYDFTVNYNMINPRISRILKKQRRNANNKK